MSNPARRDRRRDPRLPAAHSSPNVTLSLRTVVLEYAVEAVEVHGALRGSALAARRLSRCHPLGGFGIDPVPPRRAPEARS